MRRDFSTPTQGTFPNLPNLKEAKTMLDNSTLAEESLSKIKQTPEEAQKIIQSLSLDIRKQLALILVEKNPKVLVQNMSFFEIKDEKIRIQLLISAFNAKNHPFDSTNDWHIFCCQNFKTFQITDKDSITNFATFLLACYRKHGLTNLVLEDMGITDPEIILNIILTASEKHPYHLLNSNFQLSTLLDRLKIKNPDVKEKIILHLAQNASTTAFNANYLFHLAKQLPTLTENLKFRETVALIIAERSPKSLTSHLKSLNLPKEALEKIVLKMITFTEDLREIMKEVLSLDVKDKTFIDTITLAFASKDWEALIGNLKILNPSKKILYEIIPKMIDATLNDDWNTASNLKKILQELPLVLNIKEDQSFIETIVLTIFDKSPGALIGHLKSLNLSETVLQKIIPKILTLRGIKRLSRFLQELPILDLTKAFVLETILSILKTDPEALAGNLEPLNLSVGILKEVLSEMVSSQISSFFLEKLIEELPRLSISKDTQFVEKITLSILEKNPCPLVGQLKPLNLNEKVLKTVISNIINRIKEDESQDILGISKEEAYRVLLKELPTLNICDPIFIENTLLTISEKCPGSFRKNLKNFKIQNKEILSQITLNMLFSDIASDHFFLKKMPETDESIKSRIEILKFLQRPTIQEALCQEDSSFEEALISTLNQLAMTGIPNQQKQNLFLNICHEHMNPTLSISEITKFLKITTDLLNSHYYSSSDSLFNQIIENYKYRAIETNPTNKDLVIPNIAVCSILTDEDFENASRDQVDYPPTSKEILEQSLNYIKNPPFLNLKKIFIHPFYPITFGGVFVDVTTCDLEAMNISKAKAEKLIMHFTSTISQPIKLLKSLAPLEEKFTEELQKIGISFTESDNPDFIIPGVGFFIPGPPKVNSTLKVKEEMIDSVLLKAERKIDLNKHGSPTFVGFVDSDQANTFLIQGNTFKEDLSVSRMILHGRNTHRIAILALIESLKGTEFEDVNSKNILTLLIQGKLLGRSVWESLFDTTQNMTEKKNPDAFNYNCSSPFVLNSLILCFGDKFGLPNLMHCMQNSFWKAAYEMVDKIQQDSPSSEINKESIYLKIMKELTSLGRIGNVGQGFAFTQSRESAALNPKYIPHPANIPGIKLELP